MKFIHHDDQGSELAFVILEKNFGNNYFIQQFCKEENWPKVSPAVWTQLIEDAYQESAKLKVSSIQFRLIEKFDSRSLVKKLSELNFRKVQERVEYRTPLENLPQETTGPIKWKPIPSLEDSELENLVKVLALVATGDPNFNPLNDNLSELKADLADPTLSTGRECVHLGFIEGAIAALVIAQVAPKTGWSRITYMGLAPEWRGKGLGKWVHRHGFKMLRDQGGEVYHGGTTTGNLAMIRLFETQGCQMYRRMQEWKWEEP